MIRYIHDEQTFDESASGSGIAHGAGPVMAALSMPSPLARTGGRRRQGGAFLRLMSGDQVIRPTSGAEPLPESAEGPFLVVVPDRQRASRTRRRTSQSVRFRRTMLAVTGLFLIGLALPLGGTGGHSHTPGSALAGAGHAVEYTVQPGDSLWSIAVAVDPSADPRPLVAKLAAQTGSSSVEPGERIALP